MAAAGPPSALLTESSLYRAPRPASRGLRDRNRRRTGRGGHSCKGVGLTGAEQIVPPGAPISRAVFTKIARTSFGFNAGLRSSISAATR